MTMYIYKNRSDSIPFVKGLVMSLSSVTAAEYIFLDNKHYDILYNNAYGIMFAKKSGLYYVSTLHLRRGLGINTSGHVISFGYYLCFCILIILFLLFKHAR